MLLLLAAPLGETDKDAINIKYIAKLFGEDWGFYHTATNNLKKIKEATTGVKALTEVQRTVIAGKVDQFLQYLEKTPKIRQVEGKGKSWRKEAWYKEVSDWA